MSWTARTDTVAHSLFCLLVRATTAAFAAPAAVALLLLLVGRRRRCLCCATRLALTGSW
jgi:hypothetical protein